MPATATGQGAQLVLTGDAQAAARGAYASTIAGNDEAMRLSLLVGTAYQSNLVRPTAPRRALITNGLNTGLMAVATTPASVSTGFQVFTAPSDAYAVRFIVCNSLVNTWTTPVIKFVPSTSMNNAYTPTGGATWRVVTWSNAGADISEPVYTSATTTMTIPAAGAADPDTGSTSVLIPTLSDWMPLESGAAVGWPASATSLQYLFVRSLWPVSTTYARPQHSASTYAPVLSNSFDYRGLLNQSGDWVTNPTTNPGSALANNASGISAVQFLCRSGGVTVLFGGDSHWDGTTSTASSTTGGVGYAHRGIVAASRPGLPVFPVCTAQGAKATDTIWPTLIKFVPIVKPSVALIPITSINDSQANWHTGMSRMMMVVRSVEEQGGVPIIVGMLPHTAAVSGNAEWNDILARMDAMTNYLTFNPASYIGNRVGGVLNGTYQSGLSDDGDHPNDAGHAFLTPILANLIRSAIG